MRTLPAQLICITVVLIASISAAADDADWTGRWDTRWRGGGGVISMQQSGNSVEGQYELYSGRVVGRVEGRRLIGEWIENQAPSLRRGPLVFTMAPDGQSFSGSFDSGEWWSGERLLGLPDGAFAVADLASPRACVKSFLIAGNRVRFGDFDYLATAIDCIDFGEAGASLLRGEKASIAVALYSLLDLCTFRIWELPAASQGPETTLTFKQAGTQQEMRLALRQDAAGRWRFVSTSVEELGAKRRELLTARGVEEINPDHYLKLTTPRDAMRTFLEGMKRSKHEGRAQALSALQLQSDGDQFEALEGPLSSGYLKEVLDRVSYVVLQEVPDDPESTTPYVHYSHRLGKIIIAPVERDGRTQWLFTSETLRMLPALYRAIEQAPRIEGSADGDRPILFFQIRDWMRSVSGWLLAPVLGLEAWQWVAVAVTLTLGTLSAFALTGLALLVMRRFFRAEHFELEKGLERRFLRPIRLLILALTAYLGLSVIGLPDDVLRIALVVTFCAIGAAGISTALQLCDVASAYSHRRASATQSFYDDMLVTLITSVAKIVIVIAGVIVIAESLSIPYRNLLAGLGIGGLAFAIAARDTIANFFGSAVLLMDRPFRKGDYVIVDAVEGEIERVGIRSTQIRTFHDSIVFIPNSNLANMKIDNMGRRRQRRICTRIGVTYETPPDKLDATCQRLRDVLQADPLVSNHRILVSVQTFADSAIEIELIFYLLVNTFDQERQEHHRLMLTFMRTVEEMGLSFAYPTRRVLMETSAPLEHLSADRETGRAQMSAPALGDLGAALADAPVAIAPRPR